MLLWVAALLVLACAPRLAWAADTATIVARVRVFQEYQVATSGLPTSFEYRIKPVEEGAPLPVDASGKRFDRLTLTRDEDRWLEFPVEVALDLSATPSAYHYVLEPVEKTLGSGLYYVDVQSTSLAAGVNVYYLELEVYPSSADASASQVVPLVHVEGVDGPKVTDPGWRIAYTAPKSDTMKSAGTNKASTATASRDSTGGGRLAQTGDPLATVAVVAACLAYAGLMLFGWAALLRRRAGEGRE